MVEKMSTTRDSAALKAHLEKYTRAERTVIIDKIVSGCMVPRSTIYNWIYGCCRIPALHKCKIEEIVGEKIFFTAQSA